MRCAIGDFAIVCSVIAHVGARWLGERSGLVAPPQVQILSPGRGDVCQRTDAASSPRRTAGAATTVIFFVDGRQVCALTALPFECEWDPGSSIREHQVRLVVNLVGRRAPVETVRTKALDLCGDGRRRRRAGDSHGRGRSREFCRGAAHNPRFASQRTDGRKTSRTSRPRTCRSNCSWRWISAGAWHPPCRNSKQL